MSAPKKKPVPLREIEGLFDRALALPKTARDLFIKQQCTGRPELEAEVFSLLRSYEAAPEFLSGRPPLEKAIQHKEALIHSDGQEFRPKAFDNYVLLRKMGIGGMAEIFHALVKGVGGFEKHVAIKSILPTLTGEESLRSLFENEARINSALNHANIAQVYDFFRSGNNYFLSMEFVAGKNLRQVLDKLHGTRISQSLACHITCEVAKGLAYAHAMKSGTQGIPLGIIHRDISPKNIMCSYDGEVKIIDFGIAKARERMLAETRSMTLKGTFRYMSPEQAMAGQLDHRSDIFSLGLVFYELLTGKAVFQATELMKVMNEIRAYTGIEKHLEGMDIPSPLVAILKRCLAKSPEGRYANTDDLSRELDRYLRNITFESGYARVSQFMQSLFSEEIAEERLETAKALSTAERCEKEVTQITGTDTVSGNIMAPVRLETVSLILPKPSSQKPPFSAHDSWAPDVRVRQKKNTPLRWIAPGLLLIGVIQAYWLSRPPIPEPEVSLPTVIKTEITPPAVPAITPELEKLVEKAPQRVVPLEVLAPPAGQEFFENSIPQGITFSWRGRPGSLYRLQISRKSDFTQIVSSTDTSKHNVNYRRKNLTPGKYYWHVEALDNSGNAIEKTATYIFVYHPAPLLLPPSSRVNVDGP